MAYRDTNSIWAQGLGLVLTSLVVLFVVAWMLMSFLGDAMAEARCNVETPDDQMENCDDNDQP